MVEEGVMEGMEEGGAVVVSAVVCHGVPGCRLSDRTEQSQGDLRGALERIPRRPKTCHRRLIADELHE